MPLFYFCFFWAFLKNLCVWLASKRSQILRKISIQTMASILKQPVILVQD